MKGRDFMEKGQTDCIYLIVPCYNEEDGLEKSIRILSEKINELKMKKLFSKGKIICVDDGSEDKTWNIIKKHASGAPEQIIGLKLAHNTGHQNALLAGIERAYQETDCACSITIDADLQQDVNAIEEFISRYLAGDDVVYGVRNSRSTDGVWKRMTAGIFYKVMAFMGTEVIENHADYRLLSRRAMAALLEYKEANLFLRGLVTQLGFSSSIVYFNVHERETGASKYTTKKMLRLAADGITSFSTKPLHMIAGLGIAVSFLSIIMIIYCVAAFIMGQTIQGWTSILCSIWLFCGIIIFSIGVVGEYIGKTYIETKRRPRYYVEEDTAKEEQSGNAKDRE